MKREDVKKQIPGITEEQLNWVMQANGEDINREKSAAAALQTQLDNANAQLKTAQDGLKAFEGKKKPEEYEAELTKLKADMKAQADGFAFDNALNTAIMGKKGRSVKAVRALLDVDALKGSTDRIMSMTEKQVDHRIDMEKTIVKKKFFQSTLGQVLATILILFFGFISYSLAMNGHDTVAGIIGVTTVIGLAVVFVLNKIPPIYQKGEQ